MKKPLLILFCLAAFAGCERSVPRENQTLQYFENVEIQYSEDSDRKKLLQGLNDALNLSATELAAKRYADYEGNESSWDLKTLFERHMVPDATGKSLGDDFFEQLKAPEVQEHLSRIKSQLQSDAGSPAG